MDKQKETKVVELTDEELAKVVGGVGAGSCPNDYTACTEACLNASCDKLKLTSGQYRCGNFVPGNFKAANGDDIGKLAKQ